MTQSATSVLLKQVEDAIKEIDAVDPLIECGQADCKAHHEMVRRAAVRDRATKLILQMLCIIYEREKEAHSFWSTLPGTPGGSIPAILLLIILLIVARAMGIKIPGMTP
jgi:hypothetical protein